MVVESMIPNKVRKLRSLLERRECAATRTASPKDAVVLADLTEPKTTEGAYLFRREEKKVVIA